MQTQEFLERYRQGERNFAHVDLSGASLSGVNLREIDLTGANLTGANLSWSFLSNAQFTGAVLRRADLRNAVLTRANLNQSNLSGTNLTKADLRLASLQKVDLNWAILPEADLTGADLTGSRSDQINLEKAKLDGAKLMGAELMEANLHHASLIGADLTEANLREANLSEANLREALLKSTNLTEANLTGVSLRSANLSEADMHRVILTGADLTEAILNNADLSRANLAGAYLLKSRFKKAYLLRANLQDVYLLWADLSEANLRGADLRRADLSGAYLSETVLSEADLRDTFLIESHLIRTNLEAAQLTGCCIYNWHLEDVELSKVECEYVFTQFNYQTKSATNRYPVDRNFAPGELGKEHEANSSVIEVSFTEAPNWEALVFTLTQMQRENHELTLTIQDFTSLENHWLLKVNTNRLINAKILSEQILSHYPEMVKKVVEKRQQILKILNLVNSDSEEPVSEKPPGTPPKEDPEKRQVIYKEISRQIKSILLSQEPENFVDHVQRLLDYLTQQGISTEDIQKKIIVGVIVQRAKQDATFQEHLLQWEKTATTGARSSLVGKAVRFAIKSCQTST